MEVAGGAGMRSRASLALAALTLVPASCGDGAPDYRRYDVRHDLAVNDVRVAVDWDGVEGDWRVSVFDPTWFDVDPEGRVTLHLDVGVHKGTCIHPHVVISGLYVAAEGRESGGEVDCATYVPTGGCPLAWGEEDPAAVSCGGLLSGSITVEATSERIAIRFDDALLDFSSVPEDFPGIRRLVLDGEYVAPVEFVDEGLYPAASACP
jgi:hypothetical protein